MEAAQEEGRPAKRTKTEELVKCSACLDVEVCPWSMQCGHHMCAECLYRAFGANEYRCPQCRAGVTKVTIFQEHTVHAQICVQEQDKDQRERDADVRRLTAGPQFVYVSKKKPVSSVDPPTFFKMMRAVFSDNGIAEKMIRAKNDLADAKGRREAATVALRYARMDVQRAEDALHQF